ncbi:iron chelate uptake ABC transporter family permease subunit [Rapidithrix thailandica]|uniref:Iron chelate uptake ABC transporter family permease subunit n=1 Tax=Rapidithrix thailandica TaxID=413964 RepID=A0AAW9RNN5_9BACT
MGNLFEFLLLDDPNVRWVLLAVVLMSASSGVVGTFTFLRKRALIGDAISHAILPGICLAFMLAQTKNPFFLLLGAFTTGWLGLFCIDMITARTKLKPDAALGLVLSVFYGFGVLLLSIIQNSGNAAQSGLDKFLFGKAAAMVQEDVMVFGLFSLVLISVVIYFFKAFTLITFDREYAGTIGIPVKRMELLISVLTVFAIAIGIQAVGVILMAALLITPAAAARYWTENLKWMIFLSAVFAIFAGMMGTFISYTLPKMPTGPWIVTVLSLLTVFSVLLGKKRGILYELQTQNRVKKQILGENILKCLYHLGETDDAYQRYRAFDLIQDTRSIPTRDLKRGLIILQKKNLVTVTGKEVALTPSGVEEGRRVTKIHRLWEIYLTKHMQLPSDHVHEDAEAIEHIITPELERELEKQLEYPLVDPHASPVPYKGKE